MIKLANEKECNIFVIAGDLFDKVSGITKKVLSETIKALDSFNGECVVILPGNHDYDNGMIELWTSIRSNLPEKVLIVNEKQPYNLDEYGISATIYPAPCHEKHSDTNNLGWIKEENIDDSRINIGIGHGAIIDISPDLNNQYFSMTLEELNRIPLDLWLIGHTHITYPTNESVRDVKVFNPGTPEPDGLDCKHKGHAWIISIDKEKKISADRIVTGTYKFIDKEYAIETKDDLDAIMNELLSDKPEMTIARIALKGRIDEDTMDYYKEVCNKLNNRLAFLMTDVNDLGIRITTDKIHKEFSDGSFPQELLLSLSDDEDTLQLAYELIMEVRE
jgi:DNA repair exonuclease SbcCD nuclease subunit